MILPPLHVPIDRAAALARLFWRFMAAAILCGAVVVVFRGQDWPLGWRTDRSSTLAIAVLLGLLSIVAAVTAWSGLRWLGLAVWPDHPGVEITDAGCELRLGPFGRQFIAAPDLIVESLDLDLDDPAEWMDLAAPCVRVRGSNVDLWETVIQFCGSRNAALLCRLFKRIRAAAGGGSGRLMASEGSDLDPAI